MVFPKNDYPEEWNLNAHGDHRTRRTQKLISQVVEQKKKAIPLGEKYKERKEQVAHIREFLRCQRVELGHLKEYVWQEKKQQLRAISWWDHRTQTH